MMGSELLAHVHVCFQCCVVNCNVQSSVTCMFCEFLSGTLTCSMFLAVVMFLRSFGTSFLVAHDLCEGVFNVHRCIVVQRLHMYEECQCGIMSRNVRDTTMFGGRSNVLKWTAMLVFQTRQFFSSFYWVFLLKKKLVCANAVWCQLFHIVVQVHQVWKSH